MVNIDAPGATWKLNGAIATGAGAGGEFPVEVIVVDWGLTVTGAGAVITGAGKVIFDITRYMIPEATEPRLARVLSEPMMMLMIPMVVRIPGRACAGRA
jgi:hypothetical protein